MKTILEMLKLRPTKGDLGIEIEMEGNRLPQALQKWWIVHHDGSLRGNAFEYVLHSPVEVGSAQKVLSFLWDAFAALDSLLKPSDRCGVHIHLNMQKWTFTETMTFICLYLVLEELLVKWCGEDREGNIFCLRGKDADYIYNVLQAAQEAGSFSGVRGFNGDLRYSSINIVSLAKFGSLEFRSLRTPKTPDTILTWIELLEKIRQASRDFSLPPAVVEGVSMNGAADFLRMVLGDKYTQVLTRGISQPELERMLFDGVRRVQEVAYTEQIPQDERKKKRGGGLEELLQGAQPQPRWVPDDPMEDMEDDFDEDELDDDDF